MAFEIPLFQPGGLKAAADLSGKQFYCIKLNTTADEVALCDTDGEGVFAILQNKPTSGLAATPMCAGISKVVAGETLVKGDYWGTDVNGKAKKVERTNTGADTGDIVMGQVIAGAAADEFATVSIGLLTFQVESV